MESVGSELDLVGVALHCGRCGRRFSVQSPKLGRDGSSGVDAVAASDDDRVLPTVSFPDLPSPGEPSAWLPGWMRPTSERGRRVLATAFVVLLLTTGVAAATAVLPFLGPDAFEEENDEERHDGPMTWNEYEAIVMFRNDDIQAWYMQEELRELDRLFLERDIAITHGVITTVDDETDITEDEELCAYLAELSREYPDLHEAANHGLTHEDQTDFYNGSEFGGVPLETQEAWLAEADAIIEECVDHDVETFIPPMNTYDENTVTALDEVGYTTVSGAGWMTEALYGESRAFREGGLVHAPMWEDASMLNWSDPNPDYYEFEELQATFDEALEANAAYVHMLHYFTFTEDEHFELMADFLDYVDDHDVRFMTIGEFGQGVADGDVERTDDGWSVREPVHENDGDADDGDADDGEETPNDGAEPGVDG